MLGDKTRMPSLTVHPGAYIRPSPSRGHLGRTQCFMVEERPENADPGLLKKKSESIGFLVFEIYDYCFPNVEEEFLLTKTLLTIE